MPRVHTKMRLRGVRGVSHVYLHPVDLLDTSPGKEIDVDGNWLCVAYDNNTVLLNEVTDAAYLEGTWLGTPEDDDPRAMTENDVCLKTEDGVLSTERGKITVECEDNEVRVTL